MWIGFAHDIDIRARALRSRLATNSISTVCSRYGQSSTHSCSIDLLFLFEFIDGAGGRPGNSEALVGDIDRTLVSTNEVSTQILPDARVLLVLLAVLAGIWAVSAIHKYDRP